LTFSPFDFRLLIELRMAIVTAKDSPVHGQGLFAARHIRAGETILDWRECSQTLSPRDIENLSPDERKRVSFIDGQYILFQPPACWVNHSCDANARGADQHDVAIRDINPGEEITVNYILEEVPGLDFQCRCGSSNCLGRVTNRRSVQNL
jgi:SET domain-containing protein